MTEKLQNKQQVKAANEKYQNCFEPHANFHIFFGFNLGCNLNASKEGWLCALWRWISPPSKGY